MVIKCNVETCCIRKSNNKKTIKMKKLVILTAAFCFCLSINAQILRVEELEKYAMEKYGEKWVDAAENLGSKITLDKNNAITFVQVIPAEGKSKEQLYVLLNYWFTASFNDSKSVINLNDKELGIIIAEGNIADIAQHFGTIYGYYVSIKPVIKCDIKDGKVRVTYTLPFYNVVRFLTVNKNARNNETWLLDSCFPFVKKDSHKKASSKALVMAHAYSNVVIDKIEECIKSGLTGNENENW